ncbi:MAG TPA: YggS family pyridoxal phosphate-dependent enzyme [Clostridia bacterium]|jgi:pyridoxal phosphate enzyme (YggS family)|nr:YggS family pyridoxal phosphate-dependent enzyme [Clostridia bacterium]
MKQIAAVQAAIEKACLKVNRCPSEVKLLAISKSVPVEVIHKAYQAGLNLFGENRVQELTQKIPLLPAEIKWHLVGTLQRNKVKQVIGRVDLIHSVDRLSLAREISKWAQKSDITVKVLLQVNIAGEKTKKGFTVEEVRGQLETLSNLPNLQIKGLMTLAPWVQDPEKVRPVFRELRLLAQELASMGLANVEMQELSMGMSNDFPVAIEEGATIVRIGSRLFGVRN